jgi:PAS domain S-box-containing protein
LKFLNKFLEYSGLNAFGRTNDDDATRDFTRGYWLALVATGLLFWLSYEIWIVALDKQAYFVQQVNLIGSQNAITQDIAKKIMFIELSKGKKAIEEEILELEQTLKDFEIQHQRMVETEIFLKNQGFENKILDSLFKENQFAYNPIIDATKSFLTLKKEFLDKKDNSNNESSLPPHFFNKIAINIQKVLFKEHTHTEILRSMSILYEKEANDYLLGNKFYQKIVLFIVVLVLAFQAFIMFPPIVQKLKKFIALSIQNQQETEQKNKEISLAYSKLQTTEEESRKQSEILQQKNIDLERVQFEITQANKEISKKHKELEESYDYINNLKELEASRFFDTAQNRFAQTMRWKTEQTIYTWSENLLSELVPSFEALQATLYAYEEDKKVLILVGAYGVNEEVYFQYDNITLGENLVGQVAKNLKIVYLKDLNGQAHSYAQSTGTEEAILPNSLLVFPITYNDVLAGVLELTSLKPLDERFIELLKKMSETIGANLKALQDQKNINQLFADSQMAEKKLKRSLIKLQENEERFRKLSELTQEGLLFVQDGIIKDCNSIMINMFGYADTKDFLQLSYIELIDPKYRIELEKNNFFEDNKTQETIAIRRNNETFPIEIQARQVQYQNENINIISIRDITEKKRTEKQLEEANRIASLVSELEAKNKSITSSIEYAHRIQSAILPEKSNFNIGYAESFVLYLPKDIVSGDFYWYAQKNNFVIIGAIDCTGHGVPGALMSVIGYSNLNKIVMEQGITDPATILERLDIEVKNTLRQQEGNSQSRDGMDLALCSLDMNTGKLYFAGAHRPLYFVPKIQENSNQDINQDSNQSIIEYKGTALPIGGNFMYKNSLSYITHEIQLQKGDTCYIFSDGYPDQFGEEKGQKYMTRRIKNKLIEIQPYDLETQKNILQEEFLAWKGKHKQMDDVLFIGMRY